MRSPTPRAKPVIAVVNHDEAFLAMMAEFLDIEGYAPGCFLADDRALDRLLALAPDLVVLDISIHHRAADWALIEDFRAREETRHLPVIICTADRAAVREHVDTIAALGCALVEKPFSLADLLAAITRLHPGSRHTAR